MATRNGHRSTTAGAVLMILAVAGVATMIFGAFVIGLVVALVGIFGFIGLAASNALRSHQPAHLGG
jgi:hypothetical protein